MMRALLWSRNRLPWRKDTRQIPVVGIVRFSVLFAERNYFAEMEGLSLEERRQRLFDPVRLENRFRHFEALCLPSLISQSDPDWSAIVAYSSELPEPWKSRLLDQLAPHSHLRAVAVPPDLRLLKAIRAQLEEIVPDQNELCITFRLDHDDGLANYYVQRLKEVASKYKVNRTAITFPVGYSLQAMRERQGFRISEKVHEFGIALGLAMISEAGDRRNVHCLGVPHRLIDRKYHTVVDSRDPIYVCSAHDHNDSKRGSNILNHHRALSKIEPQPIHEVREILSEEFSHLYIDILLK